MIDAANAAEIVTPIQASAEPEPMLPGSTKVLAQRDDEEPVSITLKAYRTIFADKGFRLLTDLATAGPTKKTKVGAGDGTAQRAGSDDPMCDWAQPVDDEDPDGPRVFCAGVAEHGGDHLLMPVAGIIRTLSVDAVLRWSAASSERASLAFDAEQERSKPRATLLEGLAKIVGVDSADEQGDGKSPETTDDEGGETEGDDEPDEEQPE